MYAPVFVLGTTLSVRSVIIPTYRVILPCYQLVHFVNSL